MVLARNNRSSALSTLNMSLLSSPCSSRRMCLAQPLSSLLGASPVHRSRDNGNRAKVEGQSHTTESCHGNERLRLGNNIVGLSQRITLPRASGEDCQVLLSPTKKVRAYAACCDYTLRSQNNYGTVIIQVHHPKKKIVHSQQPALFNRAQAWGGGGENETEMK